MKMTRSQKRALAAGLECLGIVVTSVGIGCELAYGGYTYLVVITVGSCVIATGAMLWAKVKL